jgi:periplasmic protein TonB
MRTYTLVFSIVAHVTIACAALFSTVLATDELPEPRRASVFVEVFSSPTPPPPPPAPVRVTQPTPTPGIPFEAPEGVHAEVEQPLIADLVDDVPTSVIGGIGSDPALVLRDEPPPPPPAPTGPQRVGGSIRPPEKIVHVPPKYPPIALSAGITGVVILEATIAEDGSVVGLRVLRSEPLLDSAAIEAVRQWRFTPTLLNGQPVSVLMTVTVAFTRK